MARLRGPQGCPWDREQDHRSLLRFLKEETQEVVEAVEKEDWDNLKEELGDVLLHVLFHAQMAEEAGRFSMAEVMGTLKAKLIRRHPHVFGPGKKEKLSSAEVKRRWQLIKAEERRGKTAA